MTWQTAFLPQIPLHGSIHFSFMQALSFGHSLLITHSGLQYGGLPMKLAMHEHTGRPRFI
jgi:hypothetical protein